jgi:hypothetical protein
MTPMIVQKLSDVAQLTTDDFGKFLFSVPKAFLFSHYDDNCIHPFFEPARHGNVLIQEVRYGNYYIILEAIRQQLTQGKGLLCPFWMYAPDRCCNSDNRALLENVWKCTSQSSCKLWQRLGCLNQ